MVKCMLSDILLINRMIWFAFLLLCCCNGIENSPQGKGIVFRLIDRLSIEGITL